ncbi:Uncharacterized protein APZ42_015865 [Daphnia magna]|uniref:Uncharacterized protein n=1 Tax=Daphnia magna TaxID=35525 RepID=A0A162ND80_9CRUS|nr:Uncharacterized protein APZ42_015865 [Daphnia magna]
MCCSRVRSRVQSLQYRHQVGSQRYLVSSKIRNKNDQNKTNSPEIIGILRRHTETVSSDTRHHCGEAQSKEKDNLDVSKKN